MKRVILAKPYGLNPEVIRWVEAFATCAIGGNKVATKMIDLWNSGKRDEFVKRLEEDWL